MKVINDLHPLEWQWLLKIYRHDTAFLTKVMAKRLEKRGLLRPVIGGFVVSREGERLIIKEFAPVIIARKQKEYRLTELQKAKREQDRLLESRRGR